MGDIEEKTVAEEEALHFQKIMKAFLFYKRWALTKCAMQEKSYKSLSREHQALISHIPDHLDQVRLCIQHNFEVVREFVKEAATMFENADHGHSASGACGVSESDMDKLRSTLQQLVRDWAAEGKVERDSCYVPVLQAAERLWPDIKSRSDVKVLVPGAGLGRLAYDFASRGFTCQGNEWSLFMLFVSNFVLNKCREPEVLTVYPWVHQFSNNKKSSDQLKPVKFPDISPANLPPDSNFSMVAGDFLEVYTDPDAWDCVASVFFIDTASNILAYVETIYSILKPGGVWINIGPLLYHYADMPGEMSVELSYEDLKRVIFKLGFELEVEKHDVETMYTQNPNSMLHYQYKSVFFVARKPANSACSNATQHSLLRTAHSEAAAPHCEDQVHDHDG